MEKVLTITISQAMGHGQQNGWTEQHGGTKIEVKIVVHDDKVEEVIELISKIDKTEM